MHMYMIVVLFFNRTSTSHSSSNDCLFLSLVTTGLLPWLWSYTSWSLRHHFKFERYRKRSPIFWIVQLHQLVHSTCPIFNIRQFVLNIPRHWSNGGLEVMFWQQIFFAITRFGCVANKVHIDWIITLGMVLQGERAEVWLKKKFCVLVVNLLAFELSLANEAIVEHLDHMVMTWHSSVTMVDDLHILWPFLHSMIGYRFMYIIHIYGL